MLISFSHSRILIGFPATLDISDFRHGMLVSPCASSSWTDFKAPSCVMFYKFLSRSTMCVGAEYRLNPDKVFDLFMANEGNRHEVKTFALPAEPRRGDSPQPTDRLESQVVSASTGKAKAATPPDCGPPHSPDVCRRHLKSVLEKTANAMIE